MSSVPALPSSTEAPASDSPTVHVRKVPSAGTGRIPPGLQAKLALLASRGASAPAVAPVRNPPPPPPLVSSITHPAMPPSLSERMAGMKISPAASNPAVGGRKKPALNLSQMGVMGERRGPPGTLSGMRLSGDQLPGSSATDSAFSNFKKIVDPSGKLRFSNKAIIHAKGVDFSNGSSFNINMDELELQDELGKGNYGTVRRVWHKPTKVLMAMKEIRLELDESKLNAIIMELDILHRAVHPNIVEFYGAFFIESCVYYCMEFMDAGSLDKLYESGVGVPEGVLAKVTLDVVQGLKFLKDELQVMHRDVKPTNVLVSRAGAVKLCDFGVSGQLEKSLAKTNIGCQSYMAPERIKGESLGQTGTYTVSSDVWSLGLSVVELGMGTYPYPPETYSNVFAQLQAIVNGDPPSLPTERYSPKAIEFVSRCLERNAEDRWTYAQLLAHPWLIDAEKSDVSVGEWVVSSLERKAALKLERDGIPALPTENISEITPKHEQ